MVVDALVLVHVLSAFAFVAGYVATNGLTEFVRRRHDPGARRVSLELSGTFDRVLVRTGGTLTGLSGLAVVAASGRSWSAAWIVGSIVLYALVVGLGIFVWGPRGGRVEAALAAGDEETVERVLNEPPYVVLSRLENVALVAVIALMVLRPA